MVEVALPGCFPGEVPGFRLAWVLGERPFRPVGPAQQGQPFIPVASQLLAYWTRDVGWSEGQPWLASEAMAYYLLQQCRQLGSNLLRLLLQIQNVPSEIVSYLFLCSSYNLDEVITPTKQAIRYYYNKRTKQSSWEKPFELMTAIEVSQSPVVAIDVMENGEI
ncbi:hypothetical protein GH714_010990 [Hevea brasiliensis]|uniref:WW domain-containing protein n=1 Tax=Hevea brasiliensis TaxID=3981 RepID=A0A6A6NGH6_HEVBR|nr:hypothetical protein GH714_010990 [Hevea brasiliensis]